MRFTINNREVSREEWNNSQEDGVYKIYQNGKLKSEASFVNGKEHGIAKWYHENGKLSCKTPWINNEIHGIEKSYYKNGKLQYKTPWVHNEIHGIMKRYYEDGKLKEKIPFVNGKARPNLLKPENKLKRAILLEE